VKKSSMYCVLWLTLLTLLLSGCVQVANVQNSCDGEVVNCDWSTNVNQSDNDHGGNFNEQSDAVEMLVVIGVVFVFILIFAFVVVGMGGASVSDF